MNDGETGGDKTKDLSELSEAVMVARLEDWISQQ